MEKMMIQMLKFHFLDIKMRMTHTLNNIFVMVVIHKIYPHIQLAKHSNKQVH